jgi:Cytochrome C'
MKEVTLVNNRLRRSLRRFEQKKADNARDTAMLAIIAQAIAYDTHEVKDPALVPQWESLSAEMRDAAGLLNRNIHDGDEAAAQESLARLTKSCEDCHKAFRVEVEP